MLSDQRDNAAVLVRLSGATVAEFIAVCCQSQSLGGPSSRAKEGSPRESTNQSMTITGRVATSNVS